MPKNGISMGAHITEDYSVVRRVLSRLVYVSERLFDQVGGQPADSERIDLASRLFVKQLYHSQAILKIAPDYEGAPEGAELRLDPASIAVLSRAVLETYLMLFHLCVDEVTNDVHQLRMDVWHYHDIKSRQKGCRNANPADPELPEFDRLVKEAWNKVEAHPDFSSRKEGFKKSVEKGYKHILLANQDIAESAGIHKSRYHDAYIHLSSFVHGGPLAVARLRDYYSQSDTIFGVMTEDMKTALSCLALGYLDFESLASPERDEVPAEVRQMMETCKASLRQPLTP